MLESSNLWGGWQNQSARQQDHKRACVSTPCLINFDNQNDRKPRHSSSVILPQSMATRIVVICISHVLPGVDKFKNAPMANMACQ